MASPDFYLLVPARVAGQTFRPGRGFYNATQSALITSIQNAYGTEAFWPGSDTYVAAAAANISTRFQTGDSDGVLSAIMLSAVAQSLSNSKATVGAAIQELSQTITAAVLATAGSGVKTMDFTLSAAMPTGARLLALPSIESVTLFQNAGSTNTDGLTIGTAAGGAQIGASVDTDVSAGSGFPKQFGAGGYPGMSLSGALVTARYTSSVNLNTLTAGSLKISLLYSVQP